MTGFPWLNLGYSQTDSFLSGYAAVFGVYGISWFVALSSGLLLATLLNSQKRKLSLLILFAIWISGGLLSQVSWTEVTDKPLSVILPGARFLAPNPC